MPRAVTAAAILLLSALGAWHFYTQFSSGLEHPWTIYALAEICVILAGVFGGMLVVLALQKWGHFDNRTLRAGLGDVGKQKALREMLKKAKNLLEKVEEEVNQAKSELKNAEAEEQAAQVALRKTLDRENPEPSADGGPQGSSDDVTRSTAAAKAAVAAAKAKVEKAKTNAKDAHDAAVDKREEVAEAEANLKKTPDRKILQPEYAIGQGLITRDDYNTLQNEYLAQSDLSVGLIVPLAFLLFALVMTPELGEWKGPWNLVGLGVTAVALMVLALDRRHKYRVELKSLILGNWVKKIEAAKAAEKAAKEAAKEAAAKSAAPAPPAKSAAEEQAQSKT